jgi:hypothetical protein
MGAQVGEGWGAEEAGAGDAHAAMHARHRPCRDLQTSPLLSPRPVLDFFGSVSVFLAISLSRARLSEAGRWRSGRALEGRSALLAGPPAAAQSHAGRHGNPRAWSTHLSGCFLSLGFLFIFQ